MKTREGMQIKVTGVKFVSEISTWYLSISSQMRNNKDEDFRPNKIRIKYSKCQHIWNCTVCLRVSSQFLGSNAAPQTLHPLEGHCFDSLTEVKMYLLNMFKHVKLLSRTLKLLHDYLSYIVLICEMFKFDYMTMRYSTDSCYSLWVTE